MAAHVTISCEADGSPDQEVVVEAKSASGPDHAVLSPGQSVSWWISSTSQLIITERPMRFAGSGTDAGGPGSGGPGQSNLGPAGAAGPGGASGAKVIKK